MQTTLRVEVYEGERALTKENHRLGKFDLDGIPPLPKGVAKVDVTFELDENSILTVTAVEKGAGKSKTISITNDKGRLTPEQIEKMLKDAEKYADKDKAIRERIDVKHTLQNYLDTMKKTIEDKDRLADKLDSNDKAAIRDIINETEDWLNSNEDADKETIEEHMKEMQRVCDPIIAAIYGQQGGKGGDGGGYNDEEFEDL